MSTLRTPLKNARGLGSAKEGTHHWWVQRVTAVALIPLSVWFMYSVLSLALTDHAAVTAWIAVPWHAVLLALFVVTLFYHSYLGLQVIVEDYVDSEWLKLATLLLLQFAHIALAVIAVFAVLRMALGG